MKNFGNCMNHLKFCLYGADRACKIYKGFTQNIHINSYNLGNKAHKFLPDNHCNCPTMSEIAHPGLFCNALEGQIHLRETLKGSVFFL